jgi:hypothetical protein
VGGLKGVSRAVLEFFGTEDGDDEIDEEGGGDEADEEVFHGRKVGAAGGWRLARGGRKRGAVQRNFSQTEA